MKIACVIGPEFAVVVGAHKLFFGQALKA
jgi:hypothetical protein